MQYKVVQSTVLYPEIAETKSGIKVLDTHINLEWLLQHFKAEIRYNLMSRRREISIKDHYISLEDTENEALSLVTYLATVNGFPITQIDSHLNKLAFQNQYHPIVDCIKNKPWDGIFRLEDFIMTVKSTNPELAKKIIRAWMVCSIAAAHSENGFVNNGVLVLQGKQNIGKTRWVKSLDPINCNAVKEGAFLDPGNKDTIIQMASYWITELGELDSIFKKSEIGRLKSFVTMEFDYVRMPYARRAIRLARRTAYIATVNDDNFLTDETGNRRWWTIPVISIELDHGLDMQQVWAEVYQLWQMGHPAYLTHEVQEEVNSLNQDHEKLDPFREKVLEHYDWSVNGRKWMSATAVLEDIGYTKPSKADVTRMGSVLKQITGKEPRKTNSVRVHQLPNVRLITSGT